MAKKKSIIRIRKIAVVSRNKKFDEMNLPHPPPIETALEVERRDDTLSHFSCGRVESVPSYGFIREKKS